MSVGQIDITDCTTRYGRHSAPEVAMYEAHALFIMFFRTAQVTLAARQVVAAHACRASGSIVWPFNNCCQGL